jgi:hypothetical protein
MFHRRTKGKTIGQMRREIRQKQIIRGLCVGLSTPQIAKQLKVSSDTVRDLAATPEVQTALAEYEREHFEAVDRRFRYSMNLGMEEFVRQLKKRNWKAVERLITETGIFGRLMQYYVAAGARVDHVDGGYLRQVAGQEARPRRREHPWGCGW